MARILVADDNHSIEEALHELLQDEGHEVFITRGGDHAGAKAIELLPKVRPDLVITNYSMGELSGIDVLRAVMAYDAGIPVILTSGSPRYLVLPEALAVGPCEFVGLPFNFDEFLNTIDRMLRARNTG